MPESLISLAIDAQDPRQILASSLRSLFQSGDGGETWEPLPGEPAWPQRRRIDQ